MKQNIRCGFSVIALAAGAVSWEGSKSLAAPVTTSASKTVIWTFSEAPLATDTNQYTWNTTASAQAPGFLASNKKNVSDPKMPGTWAGNVALNGVTQTSGQAASNGTTAQSSVVFSASAPVAIAGGKFQTTSNMVFTNVLDNGNNKGAAASATGKGTMFLDGGTAKSAIITQPGGVISLVKFKDNTGTVKFGPNDKGVWTDPWSISVMDVTTGSTVGSSLLGSDDGSDTGAGTFEWDESGIVLTAPIDGSSSAELDFSVGGPWVSNSSSGTVTLQNGVFTATGVFASLPWVLDDPTNPQSATLDPSYEPVLESDYQIPSSLLNTNDDYQPSISFDGSFTDVIPEPGCIGTVALAITLLSRRAAQKRRMLI